MSSITAIGTAVPPFRFDQSTISNFMETMMARENAVAARKIKAVFRASGIQQRYSVLDDYGKTSQFSFYPNDNSGKFPGTEARMKVFRKHALPLSVAAVEDMLRVTPGASLEGITHLIVVSCTGMYAPGLDIDLIRALNLNRSVHRTCIQFMGCYAAFNALKVADAVCRSAPAQKVLIICTELCSIHFQQSPTDDNILANALFGDGSASMLVESESTLKNLEMHSFYNDLALEGGHDMAWNIADEGFQMVLSSYVPDLIKGEIRPLIDSLLSTLQLRSDDVAFYAMHPGGVKILRAIEAELGLTAAQNEAAYLILKNYGNMSSATVVFVLREIFSRVTSSHHNRFIMSMGFGPGLTLESMLLKIRNSNDQAE